MGGICGFTTGPGGALPERRSVLEAMAGAQQHRGRGQDIFFSDTHISLGWRPGEARDSRTPPSLPTDEQGRFQILFDGSIHNHLQLRRDLQRRGHRFRTGESSEIIPHLYEELGRRCPEKLRGPFAFALWDSHEGILFLARDRFGIRPLYYTLVGGGVLAFASEAKALLEHPGISAEVNLAALPHYLTFQYFPDPESAFQGIHRLRPAHHLTWDGRDCRIRRYWEICFNPGTGPLDHYVDKAGHLLRESVRLHCGEGTMPGALLSSGVDSANLAALLSRRGQAQTFSVDCAGGRYDELTPARETARFLGTLHREAEIGAPEYWEALPRALRQMDEPLADPAAIALYLAAGLAAEEVKTVLSGEGADEVFGGYEIYRVPAAVAPLQWLPRPFKAALHRAATRLPEGMKGKNYLRRATTPLERRYYGNAFIFTETEKRALLNPELYREGWSPPWEITAPYYRKSAGADPATRMQHLDFYTWLPGDILHKADRMSGAHALDVQLPYLDHVLVEFAATIPTRFKMTRGMTKYVLRMAAARYLPEAVHRRPKLGFPVPLALWIREHYRDQLSALWQSEAARIFFNPAVLREMLAEHCRGGSDHARKLWTVACFLLWHDLYIG